MLRCYSVVLLGFQIVESPAACLLLKCLPCNLKVTASTSLCIFLGGLKLQNGNLHVSSTQQGDGGRERIGLCSLFLYLILHGDVQPLAEAVVQMRISFCLFISVPLLVKCGCRLWIL